MEVQVKNLFMYAFFNVCACICVCACEQAKTELQMHQRGFFLLGIGGFSLEGQKSRIKKFFFAYSPPLVFIIVACMLHFN